VIKDRTQLNGALYKMLNTEQLVVYLIFTLILIIALFNIVGSIVMMILEKKENLKTLFNIGATKRMIQKVFFLHGLFITFFGGLAGLSLGIIVIFVQQYFEPVLITPTLPYPVILSWINIFISFATIFILGSIASLLASFSIKKLDFKV
jgi:lipoprotein-releasing system permease protein